MERQSKIALEAKISHGTVRLSKSRVALFQDENPVVPKPHDLPSRYNPVPLLTFFGMLQAPLPTEKGRTLPSKKRAP